jgi:DNA uptake protein ComE-like DNA-binding protein
MRKHTGLILGAIGFATGLYLLSRSAQKKSVSQAHLTPANLDYQKDTYHDLASENLTDLNRGDASELRRLGLSQALAERIVENRPYRSKLELVSRLILPEAEYTAIRDRIVVGGGRDPIKVAG